jgi:hypothetical protein
MKANKRIRDLDRRAKYGLTKVEKKIQQEMQAHLKKRNDQLREALNK